MKHKLLALLLLAGTSAFATPGVFVGFHVGGGYYAPPPPPAPMVTYAAPVVAPAPGLAAITIGAETVMLGIRDTGRGRRTTARAGWLRGITDTAIIAAIGGANRPVDPQAMRFASARPAEGRALIASINNASRMSAAPISTA